MPKSLASSLCSCSTACRCVQSRHLAMFCPCLAKTAGECHCCTSWSWFRLVEVEGALHTASRRSEAFGGCSREKTWGTRGAPQSVAKCPGRRRVEGALEDFGSRASFKGHSGLILTFWHRFISCKCSTGCCDNESCCHSLAQSAQSPREVSWGVNVRCMASAAASPSWHQESQRTQDLPIWIRVNTGSWWQSVDSVDCSRLVEWLPWASSCVNCHGKEVPCPCPFAALPMAIWWRSPSREHSLAGYWHANRFLRQRGLCGQHGIRFLVKCATHCDMIDKM